MKDSKVKMEDVLSPVKRVEGGQQVKALTCTFFVWLIASIAITITSGVYLWEYDTEKICKAPNSLSKRSIVFRNEWVDVNRRFRDVLKIFFSVLRSATFWTYTTFGLLLHFFIADLALL